MAKPLEREDRGGAILDALAAKMAGNTAVQRVAPQVPMVELIDASSLKPVPIRWLWPGWLARGKLHVLAGAPGTGKTTLAMSLAATVSNGGVLPDGSTAKAGRVLIWSGEDDPTDTLIPRLIAAGANRDNIQFVGSVRDGAGARAFDPAKDVDRLGAVAPRNVALLIVDPLVSAVAGDSHKNAEVRRSLAPLVELAAKLDAALLGITHYSKGTQGRDPLERVSGSLAFGALARVVIGTVQKKSDSGDDDRSMIVARAKSNIGPDGGGFVYSFEQTEIPGGVSASRIVWGAALEGAPRDLLSEPETDGAAGETRDATGWLCELLADGPMEAKDVKREADQAGYAWRTMQRAMKSAGVESVRNGFGRDAKYVWRLIHARQDAPCAPPSEAGAHGVHEDGDEVLV